MEMRNRIMGWARWAGWGRFAPLAGSVLVNAIIVAGITGLTARGMQPIARPAAISVTLLPDLPPPPSRPEPHASAPRPAPPVPHRETGRKAEPAAPDAAPSFATPAPDGEVYVGPPDASAQVGPPLGLRSLLEKDPCSSVSERVRGDCSLKWAKLIERGEYVQEPTREQLKKMYPGFGEEPSCGSRHMGCIKKDERWTSLNGTHEVTRKNGASTARLGSINEMIGRLGPHNEYQRDPGFGD
jgi:hypothetical protein